MIQFDHSIQHFRVGQKVEIKNRMEGTTFEIKGIRWLDGWQYYLVSRREEQLKMGDEMTAVSP